MSSLKDSIAPLESDLKAVPPRINVYHDLPFAIMRYDPTDEFALRREIKLLATRLEAAGKEVHIIPMSELLRTSLEKVHEKDEDEGLQALVALEKGRGYLEAEVSSAHGRGGGSRSACARTIRIPTPHRACPTLSTRLTRKSKVHAPLA
jgi:hypothetical protein